MKILIIEDDVEVSDFLKHSFLNNSYLVETADNGQDGSYMARINHYDVILIDYSLPKKNGLVVCSEIRASGCNSAILFLSTTLSVQTKVQCLEAGADDYMTKPFAFEELKARIQALLRRPREIINDIISAGNMTINVKKQTVQKNAIFIHLTKTEYNLLEYLMRNKGMILSRGMILEHVWSANGDPLSNTVEAHMTNLRKKLNLKNNDIVRNVAGRGYIIDA